MGSILKATKVRKKGLITAIPFICDPISNILFGNLGECIWHTSTTTYYNTIFYNYYFFVILLSYKYVINHFTNVLYPKYVFYLIWYRFHIDSKTTLIKLINWCRTGNRMHNHIKTYDLYFSSTWYTLNKLYCFHCLYCWFTWNILYILVLLYIIFFCKTVTFYIVCFLIYIYVYRYVCNIYFSF